MCSQCTQALQVGSWIWPFMNRSLCGLLPDVHSQLYVGENRRQGQECLFGSLSWSPSVCWLLPFFWCFSFFCLCHLIFKPGFDLLCQCKSGESLQTDIKWAWACFRVLLSNCLDMVQQMGVGIGDRTSLPAVLAPLWISWGLFGVCLASSQLRKDRSMMKKRKS